MTHPFGSTNFSQRLRHAALRVSSFARRPQEIRQTPLNNLDNSEENCFNELSSEIYQNSINTCDSHTSSFEQGKTSSSQVIISLQNKCSNTTDKSELSA